MNDDSHTDLGPCCICNRLRPTVGIEMLAVKNEVPGHGWGCVICHLPFDGASAVICQDCIEGYEANRLALRFACRGYPGIDGRVPRETLTIPHEHDLSVDHDA
jgi:hypothetical protein